MSSPKGDQYEEYVFNILNSLIKQGKLPLPEGKTRLTRKKKYRGTAGNDIEVDIAIEVFRENDSIKPFFIVVIECKDYKSSIDTSKLNDFSKKLGYIRAHKGMFFTTSRFDRGTIQEAQHENIALAYLKYGDSAPIYECERTTDGNLYNRLLTDNWPNYDFVGVFNQKAYNSFAEFLTETLFLVSSEAIVPYLASEEIEKLADRCIRIAQSDQLSYVLDITLFKIGSLLGFSFGTLEISDYLLGKCDFKNKRILISTNTKDLLLPRWRFTLAHELGHAILHQQYFKDISIFDDERTLFGNIYSSADQQRMESQANLFASSLLMPKNLFLYKYKEAYDLLAIPKRFFPRVYVDNQSVNLGDYYSLVDCLSKFFHVSHQAIEIKLRNLNLIIDKRILEE